MRKKRKTAIIVSIISVIAAMAVIVITLLLLGVFSDKDGDVSDDTSNTKTEVTQSSAESKNDDYKDEASETEEAESDQKELSEDMMALMAMAMSEPEPVETIDLPRVSTCMSIELAKEALALCSGGTKTGQASLMVNSGFEVLLQEGYDKSASDESNTCAFTVGKKGIDFYGEYKDLLVIAIRGTNEGEWFSNFDFADDSHSDDAEFAENFLQAASVVSLKVIPLINDNPDAFVLICGHSRGAACANLLGMSLDDIYGQDKLYVYTFATPNTYRGSDRDIGYDNIFNFINPADVVTEVPLKEMGFHHIGKDYILPCDEETTARIASEMHILYQAAVGISEYYEDKHPLYYGGGEEVSFTPYEVMQALASSITGIKSDVNGKLNLQDIYELRDKDTSGKKGYYDDLLEQLAKIIGRDGSYGFAVFGQHMPQTYLALLDVYEGIINSMTMMPAGMELPEGAEGADLSQYIPEGMEGVDLSQYIPEGMEGVDLSQYIPEGMEGVDLSQYMPEGTEGTDLSQIIGEEP